MDGNWGGGCWVEERKKRRNGIGGGGRGDESNTYRFLGRWRGVGCARKCQRQQQQPAAPTAGSSSQQRKFFNNCGPINPARTSSAKAWARLIGQARSRRAEPHQNGQADHCEFFGGAQRLVLTSPESSLSSRRGRVAGRSSRQPSDATTTPVHVSVCALARSSARCSPGRMSGCK